MLANVLILIVGLAIYAGFGIPVVYLLAVTLLSYLAGRLIPKHKFIMWIFTGLQAVVLLYLRMQHLLPWQSVTVPIGISYFTLQIIAYHADLYRGKYEPEKNIIKYGLFVTYLPHIFIGPIESYPKMQKALKERKITWDGFFHGMARLMWGLFKKAVIASRVGVIVAAIVAEPEQYRGSYALAAMFLYAIQLYADFSGGIDIVLGASQMLGIRLSENFDTPYFSETIAEFWRRWHITLGDWLREYIYIPLGGSRKGKVRKIINTMVTFLVSGIWHGEHYLLWGLAHGVFVCLGDKMKTKSRIFNRALTIILVSFLWSFFVWPDTLTALKMIGSVFTVFNYNTFFAGIGGMGLAVSDWIVLGAGVLLLFFYDWKKTILNKRFSSFVPAGKVAITGLIALAVLIFGMYGFGFTASEFIYSRF